MRNKPITNKAKDKKIFRKTALRTNTRNVNSRISRGGVRL